MVNKNKLLVIAGSHQREITYSHSVADLLLDYYQLNLFIPKLFIGEDEATKALVWDSEDIVIAKLFEHGNGEPTSEWLNNQPLERLVFLNQFKIRNSNGKIPPRIAETFGGQGQWTSVHNPIIKEYGPTFFIDLHSFHKYTEGQKGIGMQINSCADRKFHPIITTALSNAQKEFPKIYGRSQLLIKSMRQIRSELYEKYFTKEELIELVSSNLIVNINKTDYFNKQLNSLEKEAEYLREIESNKAFDRGWHFTEYGHPEPRGNYFIFESKYWQKNQQKATANFISKYLLQELKNFSNV